MLRLVLKALISISCILISTGIASAQSVTGIGGFCQNLVVGNQNLTDGCEGKVVRIDTENGRFIYAFKLKHNYVLAFSGDLDSLETVGAKSDNNYYTRMNADRVYFGNDGNPTERQIDGRCSLLGNVEYGLTISCRSNDNERRFSALFFSPGDIKFTPINE